MDEWMDESVDIRIDTSIERMDGEHA